MSLLDAMSRPWALERRVFDSLCTIIERHASGQKLPADQIQAVVEKRGSAPTTGMDIRDGVATIPVRGVIAPHASMVNDVSQPKGTSIEAIRADINFAVAAGVDRIAFDIDSPGGFTAGVAELHDEIRALDVPTVAYTTGMMASAAYWIGCACDEVYATRAANVGSIGVYSAVYDQSARAEKEGVRAVVVKTGPAKGIGVPGAEITEEQVAVIQDQVDAIGAMFFEAVSETRGITGNTLDRATTGASFIASKAKDLGLIDGIKTRNELAAIAAGNHGGMTMAETKAHDDAVAPQATQTQEPAALDADAIRTAERERIAGLQALAKDYDEHAELIGQCIEDGTPLADAERQVFAAERKLRRAELTKARSTADEGLASGNADTTEPALAEDLSDEALKAEWASDFEAQRQHASFEWYAMTRRALAKNKTTRRAA